MTSWPPATSSSGNTLYRAPVVSALTSISGSSTIGAFFGSARSTGVTVTGTSFRCVSNCFLNVSAVNAGHVGSQLTLGTSTSVDYMSRQDIHGWNTTSSIMQRTIHAKQGTTTTGTVTVDNYSLFDHTNGLATQGSVASGWWDLTNTVDLTFASPQTNITLRPAVIVARQNGMTSIVADVQAWEFTVEILT